MLKELIEKFQALIRKADGTKEVYGIQYAYSGEKLEPVMTPVAEPLKAHTLQVVADYLDGDLDDFTRYSPVSKGEFAADMFSEKPSKMIIHVKSPDTVTVCRELTGSTRQREILLDCHRYGDKFPFGQFMPQEDFCIALQSMFVKTDIRDHILKVAGNVSSDQSQKLKDDGVTQEVTARTGVARLETIDLPNPVILQPHRTFPEVFQPESSFIFRIKDGGPGRGVMFGLFTADNENWKLAAIQEIKDWLETNVKLENKVILS